VDNALQKLCVFSLLTLLAVALLLASPARGQNVYGSIRGVITDQSGAVLPDVTLTATSVTTGVARTAVSTKDGTYEFLQLQIGDYTLRADKSGFASFAATKIHLDVNQVYVMNVRLQLGAVTQEVTVEANAVQVENTNMQLGEVITGQEIADAPLVNRDFVELQQLQPGVVGASDRFTMNFATNGSESQQNSYLINGMDSADIALNTPQVIPSPDALSEFRLVTSTINPEYGRNSGAVLNALVKSGTDQFHGDGFEFFRDTSLNGRDYFQTAPSIYHQNEFGGTVGGPLWKKHTFFFFSYQGSRFTEPQAFGVPVVGTAAEQGGNFSAVNTFNGAPPAMPGAAPTNPKVSPIPLFGDSASPCPVSSGAPCPAGTYYGRAYDNSGNLLTNGLFSTGIIPSQDFNGVSANLAKGYLPAPNLAGDEYTFNPVTTGKTDQYLFRVDHNFGAHDQIWEYSLLESDPSADTLPFVGADLPGFGDQSQAHTKEFTGAWQHTFTGNILNQLDLGYQRLNFDAVQPQIPTQPTSLGFAGIIPQDTVSAGAPAVSVSGGGAAFELGFSVYGPQPRTDETYQIGDNFSYVYGNHTLKFGYEGRRFEVHNPFYSNNNGSFSFGGTGTFSTGNAFADFLLGFPDSYVQSSGNTINARAYEHYSFAQDQWKIRTNFTLTYGIGWDINTPLSDLENGGLAINCFTPFRQSTVYPSAPQGLLFPGDPGCSSSGYRTHYNDFAPRLGFAWSPHWGWLSGPDKMSIRAGAGLYYNRGEEELTLQFLTDPPFGLTDAGVGDVGGSPSFATPFTSVNPNTVNYTVYNGSSATTTTTPSTIAAASIPNKYPFVVPKPGAPVNWAFYEPFGLATIDPNFRPPYAENYNLTIERELPGQTILTVAYVGSMGHNLETWYERNPGLPGECIADPACVANGPFFAYQYPQYHAYNSTIFGSIGTMASVGNSNYNSLQISANKHLSHGLSFLASYTYGHALDNSSSFEDHAFNGLGMDPFDFARYYGSSAYDARQRLVLDYTYDVPKIPGTAGNRFLDRALNGWVISGITAFQSGLPVTIDDQAFGLFGESSFTCPGIPMETVGVSCWDTVNVSGAVSKLNPRTNLTAAGNMGFNTSLFSQPVYGQTPFNLATGGDAGRNFFHGYGLDEWDFQLSKEIPIAESYRFELRAELYNVFNHTQFANPGGDFASPASFGLVTGIQGLPREVQLAAKFYF